MNLPFSNVTNQLSLITPAIPQQINARKKKPNAANIWKWKILANVENAAANPPIQNPTFHTHLRVIKYNPNKHMMSKTRFSIVYVLSSILFKHLLKSLSV